jgi:transcriptional regulator with XRE-family HTH domain
VSTNHTRTTPISEEVKRFGAEIRRRRQSLDLSLADLSERVGLTSNFIGTIENGMRNPSISTVLSLAKGLGAPPAELIAEAYGLTSSGLETARLFNALNAVAQNPFIEVLRVICTPDEETLPAVGPPGKSGKSETASTPTPEAPPEATATEDGSSSETSTTSETPALNTPT